MASRLTTVLRSSDEIVAACFLADRHGVLLATANGELRLASLVDRRNVRVSTIGRGYTDVVDVAAGAPGEVLVLEAGGSLLSARVGNADRVSSSVVSESLETPRSVVLEPTGAGILVAQAGRLQGVVLLDRRGRSERTLVEGLDGVSGLLALNHEQPQVLVSGISWLASIDPGGRSSRLLGTIQGGESLGWMGRGRLVGVTERSLSRIRVVDVADDRAPTVSIIEVPARPVVGMAIDDERAIVVAPHAVFEGRLDELLRLAVRVSPRSKRVFTGSYEQVDVDPSPAGLAHEDVRLVIAAPTHGCVVSAAPPELGQPPEPLFCAGHEPGWYRIDALDAAGRVVGQAEIEVSDSSADGSGPNRWLGAPSRMGSPASGSGANGGVLGYGTVKPVTGTYRVAIVLVDTTTARYTAAEGLATLQTFMAEVINGVPVGGVMSSTAAYFAETSYGKLTLAGAGFGPYQLPGAFGDYFWQNGSSTADWEPRSTCWQAIAAAADDDVDFTQFDAVLCVSRSPSATTFAWPWAYADWQVKVKDGANQSSLDRTLGFVSMPHNWTVVRPGRPIRATAAHELGHTLRLGDVYPWSGHAPDLQARELDGWDLMASEQSFPHLTLAHRRMLGWIPDTDVASYDVNSAAAQVDELVTLSPMGSLGLAAGTRRGIEINKGVGWQYLVEYRVGLAGQVGDQSLPEDDRVLVTDLAADHWDGAQRRKPLLLQRPDEDGDGSVLDAGQDFTERDRLANELAIEVTQIAAQQAKVNIRYGAGSRPDPSITPWSTDTWQSADIEVRNAVNQADPAWRNVPWHDHHNTVVATVHNAGRLDAPDVRVDFWITDMNVGGGTWQPLGTGIGSIPAGQSREIVCGTVWRPLAPGHYCIEVRIPLYQLPPPTYLVEATEGNNAARSNYDRFNSQSASTPTREKLTLTVGNPYRVEAHVALHAVQSNPLYRTFLGDSSLVLGPGETRRVQVAMECTVAHQDPLPDPDLEPFREAPNEVRVWSTITPSDARGDRGAAVLAGVLLRVESGRATRFADVRRDGDVLSGRVVTQDDSTPATAGVVVATTGDGSPDGAVTAQVARGNWQMAARAASRELELTYTGSPGYAPSSMLLGG